METIKKLPKEYPNVYWHDVNNYKHPSVTFIRFAVTPTGRRGKDFEQIRFYFKPDGIHDKKTNQQIIEEADRNTRPKRLKRGYAWGELFVQHDFSNRNFTNE